VEATAKAEKEAKDAAAKAARMRPAVPTIAPPQASVAPAAARPSAPRGSRCAGGKANGTGSARSRCSSSTQGAGSCTRSVAAGREACCTRNDCPGSNSDSSACACSSARQRRDPLLPARPAATPPGKQPSAMRPAGRCARTPRRAGKTRRSGSAIANRKSRSNAYWQSRAFARYVAGRARGWPPSRSADASAAIRPGTAFHTSIRQPRRSGWTQSRPFEQRRGPMPTGTRPGPRAARASGNAAAAVSRETPAEGRAGQAALHPQASPAPTSRSG